MPVSNHQLVPGVVTSAGRAGNGILDSGKCGTLVLGGWMWRRLKLLHPGIIPITQIWGQVFV
jgi:hypothetical protein